MGFLVLIAAVATIVTPGFMAGLIVGLWYVLPGIAGNIAGFNVTIAVLLICLISTLFKGGDFKQINSIRVYFPLLGFVALLYMLERFSFDFSDQFSKFMVAAIVGFLLCGVGIFDRNVKSMSVGFILGISVYGVFELIRVVNGGEIHAQVSAFGANPIYAAHFLGLAVLVSIGLYFANFIGRWTFLVTLGLLILFLISTGSWGPSIALVVAVLLKLPSLLDDLRGKNSHIKSNLLFWGLVLLGPVLFIAYESIEESLQGPDAQGRFAIWQLFLDHALSSPVSGIGLSEVYRIRNPLGVDKLVSPHNIFIEIWVAYGIFPLIIFVGVLLFIYSRINQLGQTMLIYIVICFSLSGSLAVTFNFWVGIALSISVGVYSGVIRRLEPKLSIQGGWHITGCQAEVVR